MDTIFAIPLPLAQPTTVNVWAVLGEPLTLVDTGPGNAEALVALEAGLAARGISLEDVEQVLVTHHHLDHVGLAPEIRRRSGARIAMLGRAADYCAGYHRRVAADREFSRAIMAAHGVPAGIIDGDEAFWRFMTENTEPFDADDVLADGDVVTAGGRQLRVIDRPGHSTTDTLYVDDAARLAFVGDHLLADVSSNTEIYPPDGRAARRPLARMEYLHNLQLTGAMPLDRLLTGHGREVTDHAALVDARGSEHATRGERIAALLDDGPQTAYELAHGLWPADVVRGQPLLVVWEVLGHLDILVVAGAATEVVDDDGCHRFLPAPPADHRHTPATRSEPRVPLVPHSG